VRTPRQPPARAPRTMNVSLPSFITTPWEGAAIANVRGVPGTVACLARTLHEQRLVLVTTHHALFADAAPARASVSIPHRNGNGCQSRRIGRSGWGRRDTVRFADVDVHVDCAVVELDEVNLAPPGWRIVEDDIAHLPPLPGERVTKIGAATGLTEGTFVDVAHASVAQVDGRARAAPAQLRVRSHVRGRAFSAAGDSGALLRDAGGAIVGLLWGVTAGGESVACPIAPVLWVLHVQPVRLVPVERLSPSIRVL
jgi:hypothetical protein